MGNVVSPVSFTISPPFRRPSIENPTLANIRVLQQAEQAQRDAECVTRVAQVFLERVQHQANRYRVQAQLRQEEADRAAARVAEEIVQLREQMEPAKHVQGPILAARHASREESAILAWEAQEGRQRAQKIREEAEGSIAGAKEEAEKAQRVADEENREAEVAKALAQQMANAAEQEVQKALEAKREAERCLEEGFQLVVIPSPYSQTLAFSHSISVAISQLFRPPEGAIPTVHEIEARQNAECAQMKAEAAAQAARDLAAEIKKTADEDREQARLRQEEADRSAAQAAEGMAQMRAQMEEAANAIKRSQELAGAVSKAAKEDAETRRLAQVAREKQERAQNRMRYADAAIQAVKEEVEMAPRAGGEQRREAEVARAQAEQTSRTAAEEIMKANEARLDAERRLKEGIRPVVTPSFEEVAAAKQRIQYREDCFHFAIAGISGSGKSSLVNAFRGLRSQDTGAAAVGLAGTTLRTTRYHDANLGNPYVWYDVPCAGTFKCRNWQYFNDQGLYVFDCILVVLDNRFTTTDLAILANARRFQIPTYIVQSKADQHIRNLMMEMGYDSDGEKDEDIERRNQLYSAVQTQLVERTRRSVRDNLDNANLSDQRVYIISSSSLLSVVTCKTPRKTIDELELLNDLGNEAHARRKARFIIREAGQG